MGTRLTVGLNALFDRLDIPANAVCSGSVFSIYFSKHPPTDYRALALTHKQPNYPMFLSLVEKGYYLSPGLGMCSLSTPMNGDHVDGLIKAVEKTLIEQR